jgi:competence protein ComEC
MMKKKIVAGSAGLLMAAVLFSGAVYSGKAAAGRDKVVPSSQKAAPAAGPAMYWIDTEGGAATLIVTPAGESVLIDTGNPGGRDADRIYHVAREVAGLKQIDHLVITHWHIDHYGGAAELARKMPIGEVIDKGIPEKLTEDAKFAERIQPYRDMAVKQHTLLQPNGQIRLRALAKGAPNLSIRFVGVDQQFVAVTKAPKPGQGCETATDKAADPTDNANSMVLVMEYGPFRFFDGGDLTWNIEKNLVCPKDLIGTVDVFQVNHHGLDQSNNPVLVKSLAPTVSIMGNGTHKGAGPQTITTLRTTPSIQAQYQLHKNIRPDSSFNTSDEYIANHTQDCQANYVKLVVAPDGKNYTVHLPATKHQRTFKTRQPGMTTKK